MWEEEGEGNNGVRKPCVERAGEGGGRRHVKGRPQVKIPIVTRF